MRTIEELEEELKERHMYVTLRFDGVWVAEVSGFGGLAGMQLQKVSARGTTIGGALSEALTRYRADFPEG